jgi:hypothetical protein
MKRLNFVIQNVLAIKQIEIKQPELINQIDSDIDITDDEY